MTSQKRAIPDVYRTRKKLHVGKSAGGSAHGDIQPRTVAHSNHDDCISDIGMALQFLKSNFPVEKFEGRLPVIIMKHQFYSILSNRTEADKQLNLLLAKGFIRMFKLGQEDDQIAIVEMKDYVSHVEKASSNNSIVGKFLKSVVMECPDLSYTKATLAKKYSIGDEDVTTLIQHGALTVRDVGSVWIAIPHAGEFVKVFHKGRAAVLAMLKRTKYKEILQQDLEERKLPKKCKLTMTYHIHDVIGSDLVKRFETSSGQMLRLKDYEL